VWPGKPLPAPGDGNPTHPGEPPLFHYMITAFKKLWEVSDFAQKVGAL
jgi:hypothetical protein